MSGLPKVEPTALPDIRIEARLDHAYARGMRQGVIMAEVGAVDKALEIAERMRAEALRVLRSGSAS